jgi:predicted amidophosphoribosyltransferase
MGLLEALAELLYPTHCAGCELPGDVLCAACIDALPLIDPAGECPRCGAPYGYLTCTECWERDWAFEAGAALGEFELPLSRAVALHKDAGERRLGAVLGSLLARQVDARWPGWTQAVAFVPATKEARARRGFDHGRGIAEQVAADLGVQLLDVLVRRSALDQRALSRDERAVNAAGTFSATGEAGGRVLLVDDVFTTGATLDAAATALVTAGASAVRVAAVARTW